ncbi:hypothetical protein JHK87_000716 [Glycine soja]|nr:hypothetical protein JHK87_000716 [Glycine soja]
MKQTHPNLDDEALDIMIENVVTNESSASMSSSTSTNVPNFEKVFVGQRVTGGNDRSTGAGATESSSSGLEKDKLLEHEEYMATPVFVHTK